jgi:hypothetical protein
MPTREKLIEQFTHEIILASPAQEGVVIRLALGPKEVKVLRA